MCRHRTIRHRSSWPSQEVESSPNTCLPKRKRLSSRRPLLVRCLCISLSTLCLLVYFVSICAHTTLCLSPCAMSISMRHVNLHVYLHVPCVCACNTCMLRACSTCMLHACAMCFTAPSLCQREASLSAHDTSVASALEGEMPCHDMSATCLLIRCSSDASSFPPR